MEPYYKHVVGNMDLYYRGYELLEGMDHLSFIFYL